nr:glycerol kinase GlpK [Polymorphobacter sp.]
MPLPDLILVLDEGTTSTRALAFDTGGTIVATAARAITQYYPASGWVEHDANELWELSRACLDEVAVAVGIERIACIGLTNQRETMVFWDRTSGAPLANAIVWQDRRGAAQCEAWIADGLEPQVQATTGLVLDPYFSVSKIAWALAEWPAVAAAAADGRLALGTVDAWLLYRLTDGRVHATDATNASRTLLMNLRTCEWDAGLVARFGVPAAALPAITDCAGPLGETVLLGRTIPITGCAGDQHAAAIGQGCLSPGMIKATYGTGTFVLAHAGTAPPVSTHRLLATLAWRLDGVAAYALEGSIFTSGAAVQWLRDGIGVIATAAETEALAGSVADSGGVVIVPAFTGMGAPHWRADVRGLITGVTAATTRAHLARATLEAVVHQTADLLDALAADGVPCERLRVDGGMVANDWLCQHLADVLGLAVERPRVIETTALGTAMLAGVGAGLFANLAEASAMHVAERVFKPAMANDERVVARAAWAHAVRQALAT